MQLDPSSDLADCLEQLRLNKAVTEAFDIRYGFKVAKQRSDELTRALREIRMFPEGSGRTRPLTGGCALPLITRCGGARPTCGDPSG